MSRTFAVLLFFTTIVASEGWPPEMFSGRNVFVTSIGVATFTAFENTRLPSPRVLPMASAATLFVKVSGVVVIVPTTTGTLIVQPPDSPIVPPVSVTVEEPGTAVTVPLTESVPVQEVVAAVEDATTMRSGSVSVKVVRGIVAAGLGFERVIARVAGSPALAGEGVKVLDPVGAVSALIPSVALASVVFQTWVPFSRAV